MMLRLIAIYERTFGRDSPRLVCPLQLYALALYGAGRLEDLVAAAARIRDIQAKAKGTCADDPE